MSGIWKEQSGKTFLIPVKPDKALCTVHQFLHFAFLLAGSHCIFGNTDLQWIGGLGAGRWEREAYYTRNQVLHEQFAHYACKKTDLPTVVS